MGKKRVRPLSFIICLTLLISLLLPPGEGMAAGLDVTDYGATVTASGENAPNESAVKVLDNSSSTKWLAFAAPSANSPVWLQIAFPAGQKYAVNAYTLTSANDSPGRDPRSWTLQGSNNGTDWTELDAKSSETFSSRFQKKSYSFANVQKFGYYRLALSQNNGEPYTQLAEVELFADTDGSDQFAVADTVSVLDLGDVQAVKKSLTLPNAGNFGTSITWVSSNPSMMTADGKLIQRPNLGEPDAHLTLTATIQKGSVSQTKSFDINVLAITAADGQYTSGTDFQSGLESSEPQPQADSDTIVSKNVGGICCGIPGLESKAGTTGRTGSASLLYSGNALNASSSYAYNRVFNADFVVRPSTRLSYWVWPEKDPAGVLVTLERKVSAYVSVDLLFSDGTYLHDLNAKDQHGIPMHPNAQGSGGFVKEDEWNFITSNIGEAAAGKTVDKILLSFDSSGKTGYFRGFVDDIVIDHDSSDEESALAAAKAALTLGDTSAVTGDLTLPSSGLQGTVIEWSSSNPQWMDQSGQLLDRPRPGEPDAEVTLTATIIKGNASVTQSFLVTVKALTDDEAVQIAVEALTLGDTSLVTENLPLSDTGEYGTSITWSSSNSAIVDESGHVHRPELGQADAIVELTASVKSGSVVRTKTFHVNVLAQGDEGDVLAAKSVLELGNLDDVKNHIVLPRSGKYGTHLEWSSSLPQVIDASGHVNRPGSDQSDANVTLTVVISKGQAQESKVFHATVKAFTAMEEAVREAVQSLSLGDTSAVTSDVHLPAAGLNGSVISWESTLPEVVDATGRVIRPCVGEPNATAALIATVRLGDASMTKAFAVTVTAVTDEEAVAMAMEKLDIGDTSSVTESVYLPVRGEQGTWISWSSSDPSVVDAKGHVTRPAEGQPDAVVTLTAEITSGDVTASKSFVLTVRAIGSGTTGQTAELTGASSVHAGEQFDLIYSAKSVSQSVYAQDITISYDPNLLDFVNAESLKDTLFVLKQSQAPGKVRILIANVDGQLSGSGLLKLQWKAKSQISATATVSLAAIISADDKGVETTVQGGSHQVQIAYIDTSALQALIADAQSKHDAAVEGSKPGQYPLGSKSVLQAAIDQAVAVAGNAISTQQEIDQAYAALESALQVFLNSVIARSPGDVNGDETYSIGDLAIVAAYYGKTSTDSNWALYKAADVNHDGKIDMIDLATVAHNILQ